MRDIYEYCGYDFHYYHGEPMDMDKITALVDSIEVENSYIRKTWTTAYGLYLDRMEPDNPDYEKYANMGRDEAIQSLLDGKMKEIRDQRLHAAEILLRGLHFINKKGQSLKMMPKLELDPELLEQELYH
jgi:hypothetical protein